MPFVCHACGRRFNERTGTLFSDLHYPTDIVLSALFWRFRYKLSLHDLAELLLVRGFAVTHETVRQWKARFAPLLADRLGEKFRGRRSVQPAAPSPLASPCRLGRWSGAPTIHVM